MPATYESIATTTLASAAASITFGSIPNTYTDLRVMFTGTHDGGNEEVKMQFNNSASTLYSFTYISGNGSAASSARLTSTTYIECGVSNVSSTIPVFVTADLFSYAGATFKTALVAVSSDLNGSGYVSRTVGLWRSTDAITSVKMYAATGNWNAGTTATLYGIARAA